MKILLALLMLSVVISAFGCQNQLFPPTNTYNQSRIDRYWGGDSAVQAREARAKASEMGFGFPTGMANQ